MQTSSRLITCITPNKTLDVMHELEEKGIFTSNTTVNRGTNHTNKEDIAIRVLTVVVSQKQAKEIFEFLYNKFKMYEPHNGLIFQQKLLKMTEYKLPNEEEIKTYIKE